MKYYSFLPKPDSIVLVITILVCFGCIYLTPSATLAELSTPAADIRVELSEPDKPDAEPLQKNKPEKKKQEIPMLDSVYDTTTDVFKDTVYKTDNLLSSTPDSEVAPLNKSRLSMAVGVKVEKNDNGRPEAKLDLDIKATVKLPKTKDRLGIFIDTSSPDELPGYDPDEVENNLFAGIQSTIGRTKLPFGTFRLGVKARIPPVAYTELMFRHHFQWKLFHVVPQVKGYWLSDDGFGEITTLTMECLPTANTLFNSTSAAKWSETTHGVEWEQSLMFGYRPGSDFKRSKRSLWIKFSVFGHKSGEYVTDLYRISMMYRRAIYKKWLFFQIGPELEFPNEDDWEPSPAIHAGIDMLFYPPDNFLD